MTGQETETVETTSTSTNTSTYGKYRAGRTLMVIMDASEREALAEYAKQRGETVSVVVRQILREAMRTA